MTITKSQREYLEGMQSNIREVLLDDNKNSRDLSVYTLTTVFELINVLLEEENEIRQNYLSW